MHPDTFSRRLSRAAQQSHRGDWRLPLLALEARDAGVPHWAERIGRHPLVRCSPKTVIHWAHAAAVAGSFVPDIGSRAVYLLPVSAWLAVAPYTTPRGGTGGTDWVDRERLVEMIETFIAENVSIQELAATLRETFGDPPAEPSILAALDTLMAKSVKAAERLPAECETRRDLERGVEWLRQARESAEREGLK